MIYKRIYFEDFIQAFKDYNRENQFSYEGLIALYDYIEECIDENSEPYELDVIGLCVDFTEYKNFDEFKQSYPDYNTLEEVEDDFLVIHTTKDSFIVPNF